MPCNELVAKVGDILEEMQQGLLARAEAFRNAHTREINSREEFEDFFGEVDEASSLQGGFALCHWNPAAVDHELLKKYKVSPRCIPLQEEGPYGRREAGTCLFTGKPSQQRVIFARAY